MQDPGQRRATGDLDRDGLVGEPGEQPQPPAAGGGGGSGSTVAEIAAEGGGSPAAQAAAERREPTGGAGPGSEAIDDPHVPGSR